MNRYGMVFRIRPELKEEYKKAHDEIWPEMAQAIHDSGLRNYSIFFRDDGTLYAYYEAEDAEKSAEYMASQEVNTRWQKAMERYFVKDDPEIIGPQIRTLEEVFHQD